MNWFYSDNGKQAGPVSQQEIESRIRDGLMQPENLVWKEGMPEWKPANQVLTLSSPASELDTVSEPQQSIVGQPANPVGSSTLNVPIKRANFKLFLTLMIVGWTVFVFGAILLGIGEESGNDGLAAAGAGIFGLGLIPLVWGTVLSFIYLYRCWLILDSCSNGAARTTPGKAVGFLFIPFYNLYWVFQAYHGWAQDYNQLAQRSGWPNQVPEGLFLGYAILTVCGAVPLINYLAGLGQLIVVPMTVFHMCKTINFHANV